ASRGCPCARLRRPRRNLRAGNAGTPPRRPVPSRHSFRGTACPPRSAPPRVVAPFGDGVGNTAPSSFAHLGAEAAVDAFEKFRRVREAAKLRLVAPRRAAAVVLA